MRKQKLNPQAKKLTIKKQLPTKDKNNYPQLLHELTNTKDLQNSNKTQTSQNHKSLTADEITIISETEIIPEKQFEQSSELSLLSPSMH